MAALILAALSAGQTWKTAWSSFYAPQGNSEEIAKCVASAKDGGMYSLTYIGGWQLTKFDSSGVVQWRTLLGFDDAPVDPSDLQMQVVEGKNGIYVAATVDRQYPVGPSVVFAKYDFSGQRIWLQYFGTAPGYTFDQIALDTNDDAFLQVTSQGGSSGVADFILAYDPNGRFSWLTKVPFQTTVGNLVQSPLQIDPFGDVYVGGLNENNGGPYIVKLSPSGVVLWTYTESFGVASNGVMHFVLGPDGSVYMPGGYSNGVSATTIVKKLSPTGTIVWSLTVTNVPASVAALDPSGALYLCSTDAEHFPGIVKVSPQGTLVWDKLTQTADACSANVDASGNLNVLEGSFPQPNRFIPGICEQFDPNGNLLWTKNSGLSGNFYSAACAFGSNSFVWACGDYQFEFAAVSRLTSSGTALWTNYNNVNANSAATKMYSSTSPAGITYFAGTSLDEPLGHNWIGAFDANGKLLFAKDIAGAVPVAVVAIPNGGAVFAFSDGMRKFDSAGNQVWFAAAGATAMTIDSSNSIFAVDGRIVNKVSSAGTLVWTATLPSDVTKASVITVDSSSSVIVGYDAAQLNGLGACKLSGAGTVLWHTVFPKTYNTDYVVKIACNSSNTVFLTFDHYTGGTTYGAIHEFGGNGLSGWQTELGANLNAPCTDSTIAPDGTIYAVGHTYNGHATTAIAFAVDSSNGGIKWVIQPNPGLDSYATNVTMDPKGNALVTGWRYAQNSSYDDFVMRVTPVGVVDASVQYDSGFNLKEYPDGIGTDSSGNAYLFGRSIGPNGNYNFNVVKYLPPLLDDATVTQSTRTSMVTTQQYPVNITVKNIGLNAWTTAAGYKLDCLQASTWKVPSLTFDPNETINPGGTKQFLVYVTAPSTPGTYSLQWRMDHSGTLFGDPSPLITITVSLQTNFATFVGQTVPTAMICGQTYTVSLQYKNAGTNTWATSGQYALQSASPYDNTLWGTTRIPMTSSSVGPGAVGTFSKALTAPSNPGNLNFQWQPIQDSTGLNFSTISPAVVVSVTKAADAAQYLSRTGATTVYAGTDFYVQNTMHNVGTNTWTGPTGYNMISVNPTGNAVFGASHLYMPSGVSVSPNFSATFTGLCTAPSIPGTYTMQWQCNHGGVVFGDLSPKLTMNVVQGPDDAQFVSASSLPSSIGPSMSFGVTFTMKNLGTATWGSGYSLISTGNNNFGVASIASSSVAPNANGTFTATCTAPSTPGTYTLQFRMAHNGTKFGDSTPLQSILVAADAALYVSRSGATTVYAGQDFWVQYTMQNVGSNVWTNTGGYSMMTINMLNNTTWTNNRAYLASGVSVSNGQQGTFTVLCTAPINPRTYAMQWQLDKSGTPFGQSTPMTDVNVILGPDDAQYISQANVATKILHGTVFEATITMLNLGTATWDASYSLAALGQTFGVSSIPATTTLQNGMCSFTADFTAPPTPGTYTFQMRMSHNGIKFGQPTPKFTVVVT